MSLLAEVVVEEWLNRQGYFTIRGVKLGYDEIDLLAVRICLDGSIERRHIEVQASVRPVSYISRVPRQVQKDSGKGANSANRSKDELQLGVDEWVEKKFHKPTKRLLLQSLGKGTWTSELVINKVTSEDEVALIQNKGVRILWLKDIVGELKANAALIKAASGADLLDLMHLASTGTNFADLEAADIGNPR